MIKLNSRDHGIVLIKDEDIESVSLYEDDNLTRIVMISGMEYSVTETPDKIKEIWRRNGVVIFE